ncbi:hypothetical protein HYH03_012658 [Edaphochlamys debaryana]|uniref:Uncharacterized protein n=1 Tax=Edaphochlamys debaryana TaxID=47281 RepID=A0A836BVB2_9CHLO|nr:hypothetical protein HYH03_012658 [Edaphochlamys debaryana]|eukprot:KAG2488863.1 hypothetical protein HYH03_012658 [Edaphochlamys debaryana]
MNTSNNTYEVPDGVTDERAARHLVHFVKEKCLLERELEDGCLAQQVLELARALECRGLEEAVADLAVEKLVAATKAKAAKAQKTKATKAANKAAKAALGHGFGRHEAFLRSLGCPQSVIDADLVDEWLEGKGSPMAERYRRGY